VVADTCPTIQDIKSSSLTGWKAYDSDDGTLLSAKRTAQFKKSIEQFALAEWKTNANHQHAIRCYYRDQNGSGLEAYLAKNHFSLAENNPAWYSVSGSMNCAAGMNECHFQQDHPAPTRMASASPSSLNQFLVDQGFTSR
jgi:hypothetical protein